MVQWLSSIAKETVAPFQRESWLLGRTVCITHGKPKLKWVVYPKVASCGEATGVCEWCSGEQLVGVRVLCREETVETWMWCRGACTERGRMPGRQGLDVIRTRQTKVREVQEGLLSGSEERTGQKQESHLVVLTLVWAGIWAGSPCLLWDLTPSAASLASEIKLVPLTYQPHCVPGICGSLVCRRSHKISAGKEAKVCMTWSHPPSNLKSH